MDTFAIILIIVCIAFILIGVIQFNYQLAENKKQKIIDEEIERERLKAIENRKISEEINLRGENSNFITSLHDRLLEANQLFESYINEDYFFKSSMLEKYEKLAQPLYTLISKIDLAKTNLTYSINATVNSFIKNYANRSTIREAHNNAYVLKEIKRELIQNFEGKTLDDNQKKAIVTNEDNNLVIAGAGSGKTTVITAKVKYLLEAKKVKEEEVLLLSFTRKACEEMNSRLTGHKKLKAITFHQLGLKIIGESTSQKPSIFDESNSREVLKAFIRDLLKDPIHSKELTNFIVNYSKPLKSTEEYENHGEYIEFIRENGIKAYKKVSKLINNKKTILREQCKSVEEVIIANYLFLNKINYEYERQYEVDTSDQTHGQYRPDFYLVDYNIYIEHFGIDRLGNVPHWFGKDNYEEANEHYQNSRAWKLNTHSRYKTSLIETFSYENTEGNLLPLLEDKLINAGVTLNPMTSSEIWQYLEKEINEDVDGFYDLISSFHSLFKAGNYSFNDLQEKAQEFVSPFEKTRISSFIELYKLYHNYYSNLLENKNVIDFNDMINNAYQHIINGEFKSPYKYILVDEYQDISISRFNLLKAIKELNEETTLFCVGDDWQSIYRFAGSDINLFTRFSKLYGETAITKIGRTYRFKKDLVNRSSSFILRNPNQISKEVSTTREDNESAIKVFFNNNLSEGNFDIFYAAIGEIGINTRHKEKATILILGRYSFDIGTLKKEMDPLKMKVVEAQVRNGEVIEEHFAFPAFPNLFAQFSTVHKSKGKEADYVILINCVSGKRGFPSQFSDDPILNLVLSEGDNYPNAEERRLFYVAITRSKEKTYILSNSIYKSKFAKEIDNDENSVNIDFCPRCVKGELFKFRDGISKRGSWQLFKCKNKNWGCDYSEFRYPDEISDL
jgi:DNA helicase-4